MTHDNNSISKMLQDWQDAIVSKSESNMEDYKIPVMELEEPALSAAINAFRTKGYSDAEIANTRIWPVEYTPSQNFEDIDNGKMTVSFTFNSEKIR